MCINTYVYKYICVYQTLHLQITRPITRTLSKRMGLYIYIYILVYSYTLTYCICIIYVIDGCIIHRVYSNNI